MKTVSYNGFQASVEYEDGALFVRVLHIDDVLVAQVDSASEVEDALKSLVDDYLDACRELGKDPQKAFSGTFNVRLDKELHRQAAVAAAEAGCTLNAWVADAVTQKVDCDRFSDRVNTVLRDVQAEVRLLHVASAKRQRTLYHRSVMERAGSLQRLDIHQIAGFVPSLEEDNVWGERLHG